MHLRETNNLGRQVTFHDHCITFTVFMQLLPVMPDNTEMVAFVQTARQTCFLHPGISVLMSWQIAFLVLVVVQRVEDLGRIHVMSASMVTMETLLITVCRAQQTNIQLCGLEVLARLQTVMIVQSVDQH